MSYQLSDIIKLGKELRLQKIREDIQKHRRTDAPVIVSQNNYDNSNESIKKISTQSSKIPKATKQPKSAKTVKVSKAKKTGLSWNQYRKTRIRKKNESYNAFQKRISPAYHKQKVTKSKKITKKPKISGTTFKDYIVFRKTHGDDRTVSVAWAKHKKKLAKSPTLNYDKLIRDNREIIIEKQRLYQDLPLKLSFNKTLEYNLDKNPIINYFDNKHYEEIKKAFYILRKDKNIQTKLSVSLKFIQGIDASKPVKPKNPNFMERYEADLKQWKSRNKIIIGNTKHKILTDDFILPYPEVEGSLKNFRVIGYIIKFLSKPDKFMKGKSINESTLMKLKAFHPSSNPQYHEMCSYSTSTNKLCIYESFLHITRILSGRKTKSFNKLVESYLSNEPSSIIKYIKNGLLINSLQELTKKYETKILIVFYDSYVKCDSNDKLYYTGADRPLLVDNGVLTIFTDDNINDLRKHNNTEAMLYQRDVHVAPFIFTIQNEDINNNDNKKSKKYVLRTQILKTKPKLNDNVLCFTFDYSNDTDNNKIVQAINIYGNVNNKNYDMKFLDVKSFIKFIDNVTEYRSHQISKTGKKNEVKDIFIYGYENSKNDNIYLYNELYNYDPCLKCCFVNNTIKHIQYKNCYIYDLSLFYKGGIKSIHNDMNLTSSDSETKQLYDIGKMHINSCTGKIDRKYYNLRKCSTVSQMSQKIFTQTMLSNSLYGSDPEIIKKERNSFYGGKNEIYKKYFESKNNDILYSYDINSAHPASMVQDMPYKYLDTYEAYEDKPFSCDEIVPWYLYLSKSVYKGNNKNYIPNLMVRNKESVNSVLDTGFNYYWGAELQEAIKDGCEVYVKEINTYSNKKIFDKFANYFYDKKKEHKRNNNLSKYFFVKNILTNLYGKFAQKPFNKTAISNNSSDEYNILKGDLEKLVSQKYIGNSNRSIIEYTDNNAEYSIGQLVRFSSYISCLTRCKLAQAMRFVGHENVYYCATDSIYTTVKLSDSMISDKLGDWDLEAKINKAYFISSGNYWYQTDDDKESCKAKAFDSSLLNEKDYIDVLNNKSVYQDFTVKFRNLENQNIKEDVQNRLMKSNYNKRKFNGNESYAYETLENWINN
jgi:hypothetical protein